ncbi:MAG TPA: glucosamine-6-phosphate deaminase [Acidimicrobiia bacterium]|nr:glucosamine-6-phosphate deaminase [Acidimicrobiia bacterium]
MRSFVVDDLTVHVHDRDNDLAADAAEEAAGAIGAAVRARGVAHVMLATGNSQLAFLDALTHRSDIDWSAVIGFHMDEYVGISADHPASFRRYLRERVVDVVHPRAFEYVEGDAPDPEAECRRYAALLAAHPLDVCCLGIGENGHLAFNDPPVADFDDPVAVKVVELDAACRRQQVGEGHFPDLDAVPRQAITVTIPALLAAARVLAVVPDARKAAPVTAALTGPIGPACPASVLRHAPQATLYLDAESAAGLAA